jgi:hypothetical protein
MRTKIDSAREHNTASMSQQETLSIHRSFVLRLYPGADLDAGEVFGRVEHVVSGETKEFNSVGDLLSSIGLLLRHVNTETDK